MTGGTTVSYSAHDNCAFILSNVLSPVRQTREWAKLEDAVDELSSKMPSPSSCVGVSRRVPPEMRKEMFGDELSVCKERDWIGCPNALVHSFFIRRS